VAVLVTLPAAAQQVTDDTVRLVLFHGEGCPHCAAEREFLTDLQQREPRLQVQEYEVWYDEANRALLAEQAQRLGFEPVGVPVTIIGDRYWVGFSDAIAAQIEDEVAAGLAGADAGSGGDQPASDAVLVDVPLVGMVELTSASLLVSTLVVGFVDGVNPCSLWALSVLLAIVLHSGSRRRVLAVGTTFLAVTAGMYALYMLGMYSAQAYVGDLGWVRVAVAVVAVVFGVLHLKDFTALHRGVSLSIPDARKPGLYARMRAVSASDTSLPAALAGTTLLAIGVSLLETPCTAGLPLLWTSLLAARDVPAGEAAALFAVYLLVFLVDELLVLTAAVVSMRALKLQERHGRLLKLVSGVLMLTLAVTMLLAPQALTSVVGTLVVFGAAGAVVTVVWAVDRSRRLSAPPPAVPARRTARSGDGARS
jgi:cytochrome c biogenesis protein CcdA/glutaredoxin